MTLPAGMNSEDGPSGRPGTGLAPVEANAGIESFLDAASAPREPEAPLPRSWRMRLFDYSAHAAMIAGLIGFAWTVGDHVVNRPTPAAGAVTSSDAAPARRTIIATANPVVKPEYAKPEFVKPEFVKPEFVKPAVVKPAVAMAEPVKPDAIRPDVARPDSAANPVELTELRRTNARMAEDIKALRSDLARLNRTVAQDQAREQIRALSASVDGVISGLATTKTETSAALAQLASKVDRVQRDARAQTIDGGTTGSLPQKSAAVEKSAPLPPVKPFAVDAGRSEVSKSESGRSEDGKSEVGRSDAGKPTRLASLEEDRRPTPDQPQKPAVIPGWTVLDVYDGVALVEGKRGAMEVMAGAAIPGAGVVRSITRTGNGWTVTTSKGVIAFGSPGHYARRAPEREAFRPYRYDF